MQNNFTKSILSFLVAGAMSACPLTAFADSGELSAGSAAGGLLGVADNSAGALLYEVENNDVRDNACSLDMNATLIGTLGNAADLDWYKVNAPYNGKLECTLEPIGYIGQVSSWSVDLFTADNTTIRESMYGVSSGKRIYSADSLAAGTYFVRVTIDANSYVNNAVYLLSTKLSGVDFKQASVEVEDVVYDGSSQEPAVTVKYGNDSLEKGVDYDVEYSNNDGPGTGIATVRGKGMFDGVIAKPFDIAAPSSNENGEGESGSGSGSGTGTGTGEDSGSGTGSGSSGSDTGEGSNEGSNGSQTGDSTGSGTADGSNPTSDGSSSTEPANGDSSGSAASGSTGSNSGTGSNAGSNSGSASGSNSSAASSASASVGRITIFRLYNPYSGEHFYTSNGSERAHLISLGWNNEGIGWVAPSSGAAVYRLYNPYSGDHHFTTSSSERDILVNLGWTSEGVGWRTAGTDGVPVYRQYNPYGEAFYHNYTASKAENDHLVSLGWLAEGVGWYGLR